MEPENSRADLQGRHPPILLQAPRARKSLEGLKSAWKVFIFLFLTLQVGPAAVYFLGYRLFAPQPRGSFTPQFLLFLEFGSFAVVLGLSVLLALIEKRSFGVYGLPLKGAFKANFWLGLLFGLAEASVLIELIQLLGGYSFGTLALHGRDILSWGVLHLFLFLFVGLNEEFLFRGYPQYSLSRFIGFWPTAILLSLGFGLTHLANRGENWVGAASVTLVGMFFTFTLRRSGNLWYAVGLHAGFDWAQSFLYSVPDSGELLNGHLSNAVLQGPAWLTGGTVGPEGSVFCFLTMGLQFLVVIWLFPAKKSEPAVDLAPA